MEHTPAETKVTVDPDTVQTAKELLVKLTAKPEVAVAVRATGPAASGVSGGCVKLMVCVLCSTLNVCVTGVAAGNVPLPAWLAVMEHVPTESNVTEEPDTVQIAGELLV